MDTNQHESKEVVREFCELARIRSIQEFILMQANRAKNFSGLSGFSTGFLTSTINH
jgi:hypothetical protein